MSLSQQRLEALDFCYAVATINLMHITDHLCEQKLYQGSCVTPCVPRLFCYGSSADLCFIPVDIRSHYGAKAPSRALTQFSVYFIMMGTVIEACERVDPRQVLTLNLCFYPHGRLGWRIP